MAFRILGTLPSQDDARHAHIAPASPPGFFFIGVAQLVERRSPKPEAVGSSPAPLANPDTAHETRHRIRGFRVVLDAACLPAGELGHGPYRGAATAGEYPDGSGLTPIVAFCTVK